MIAAGRLAASLDQVDGVLHFHATQNALDSFDEVHQGACLGVNAGPATSTRSSSPPNMRALSLHASSASATVP